MTSQSSDADEATKASGEPTFEKAKKKAQEKIDHLFNISLNIAVTGETGVGKSAFINAYRGLKDDDEGAAETGVTETTAEPTPYNHPTMPNVVLWDLPGVGTPNFKAKTYVKKMQIACVSFIIISSVRFKENEIMLAKEIQKRKKENKRKLSIKRKLSQESEMTKLVSTLNSELQSRCISNPSKKVDMLRSSSSAAFAIVSFWRLCAASLPVASVCLVACDTVTVDDSLQGLPFMWPDADLWKALRKRINVTSPELRNLEDLPSTFEGIVAASSAAADWAQLESFWQFGTVQGKYCSSNNLLHHDT
uniref:Immunity-related GTPase family, e4 n=1 Tax=Astyanax mexicanus TaxID=7994 RepID=A0A3B1J1K1_ASTMX